MDTVRAGDVGIGNGVLSRYLDEAFVDAQIVHSRLEAVRQRGLQYSRFAWLAPIFCCPHGAAVRVEPNNENFFRREQTARHLAKVPSFITLELSSASRTSRRVADVGIVCLQWKCVSVKTVFTGHCPSSKQASRCEKRHRTQTIIFGLLSRSLMRSNVVAYPETETVQQRHPYTNKKSRAAHHMLIARVPRRLATGRINTLHFVIFVCRDHAFHILLSREVVEF